jgi:hypothetical protein
LTEAAKQRKQVGRFFPGVVLAFGAALLYATSPTNGDFWWSDASRHAMNGAFFYDFFSALPFDRPMEWAVDYYLRRPAVAVGFYPPLFGIWESLFYAMLGTSHSAAQAAVNFLGWIFGLGSFALAGKWVSPISALAAALLMLGIPEMALWGRQVMLEIPAYAFLVWSVYWFVCHLEEGRNRDLALAALFFSGALFIKLSVVFLFPVFLFFLFRTFGPAHFVKPSVAWIAGGFCLLLAPLVWMTLSFGSVNVGAVSGGQAEGELSRLSVENWTYYLSQLPRQMGAAGMAFLAVSLAFLPRAIRKTSCRRRFLPVIAAWFAWGYLFFSLVSLKEPRHGVFILFPLVLLSIWSLDCAWPREFGRYFVLAFSLFVFGGSIFGAPVPYVRNHALAADYVAEHTPAGYRAMIHSYWDGNFIFGLWARGDRKDLAVLRSDKLLLRMAVKRSMGVEERGRSPEEIGRFLNENGVYFIVAETGFWDDLSAMKQFEELLETDQFERVHSIPLLGNVIPERKTLYIYRNLEAKHPGSRTLRLELPIIDREFSGQIP